MPERTTAERLAQTCRALDHMANCSPVPEVAALARVHQTLGVMLLGILEEPTLAIVAADDWDTLCRKVIRHAVEDGLVDMGPHYQSERRRQRGK